MSNVRLAVVLSDDDGANWRSVGVGPDRLTLWNGRAVGISGDPQNETTLWTWGGDIAPRNSSVDLGAADDLEVGDVRWHPEHQLYLVRTSSAVLAFAAQSPKQGCRLMLAADVDLPDPYLHDDAVFADPCHGATFASTAPISPARHHETSTSTQWRYTPGGSPSTPPA